MHVYKYVYIYIYVYICKVFTYESIFIVYANVHTLLYYGIRSILDLFMNWRGQIQQLQLGTIRHSWDLRGDLKPIQYTTYFESRTLLWIFYMSSLCWLLSSYLGCTLKCHMIVMEGGAQENNGTSTSYWCHYNLGRHQVVHIIQNILCL